ncbi:hypothetical protein [Desulfosporosinus sp.]|uniref:hypothetical protein n=1 Tax=Desulfosporosinus sp. TaxID=157907 RepID=UPI0025C386FB|nr:hypothetical protein [Desulfosporosinus sp.]MBC2727869.1 hypothetical protein [Desulfosporosinus sp.]
MDRPELNSSVRRYKAYISTMGTTQLHLRNPYIIAFWSLAFPGLGHLLLSKYLRGFLLFIWEVFINYKAHINLAILYSFTGRFEMAKEVLDITWVMLYAPTYLFSVWDSYRTTVDLNQQYTLAAREDAELKMFNINSIEINHLDKRTPWIAFAWSALMPGLGQIYIHRIPSALFTMSWFIVMAYLSKLLPAIHFTLLGQFELVKTLYISTEATHWLLNIPCIYWFSLYESYVNAVENNKLFEWEQAKFLKKNYQSELFKMPFK